MMEDNNVKDFVKKAKIYARLGKAYYLLKDLDQALHFYDRSLLEDQNPTVKDEYRRIQREKKDRDE